MVALCVCNQLVVFYVQLWRYDANHKLHVYHFNNMLVVKRRPYDQQRQQQQLQPCM
jgi:hypothetical protein